MNKVAVKKQNKNIDKQKVLEKLTGARIALLLKQPFFGNMATRMQLQEADWCPTAATDGRNFYYNPEFIDSLTPKQTEFLKIYETSSSSNKVNYFVFNKNIFYNFFIF